MFSETRFSDEDIHPRIEMFYGGAGVK